MNRTKQKQLNHQKIQFVIACNGFGLIKTKMPPSTILLTFERKRSEKKEQFVSHLIEYMFWISIETFKISTIN